MRQIDIMVNTKKAEWENQLHLAQIQVDKRNKELAFFKGQMEQQSLEVSLLLSYKCAPDTNNQGPVAAVQTFNKILKF